MRAFSVGAAARRKFLEVLLDDDLAGDLAGLVEDQVIDQPMHCQGDDHSLKNADLEHQQSRKGSKNQSVLSVVRDMPQTHYHLPSREDHDCGQRKFWQILKIV